MARRTRSSAQNSPTKEKPHQPTPVSTTDETCLPKLFILPRDRSTDARFLLLPDPRDYSTLRRYFFDPRIGPYELTRVSAGASSVDPRSILYTSDEDDSPSAPVPLPGSLADGYVVKAAEVFVATPIDVVFLALPILCPSPAQEKGSRRLLQSIDDLLDAFEGDPRHLRYVFTDVEYRTRTEKSLGTICDTVNAGEEKMFRLNEGKLAKELLTKAECVVERGLPATMEERFIARILETPMKSIHREETTASSFTTESQATENSESQSSATQSSSISAAATAVSEVSSTATLVETSEVTVTDGKRTDNAPEPVIHLLRLRTALNFLTSSYLPPSLISAVNSQLASLVDFTPLNTHLSHLSSLRASALASRSLSDFSRKRGRDDVDIDEAESQAEKKRRMEEDEKRRKASESKGVRELKKVDVSGMKKMSDFFRKKPAVAGAKARS